MSATATSANGNRQPENRVGEIYFDDFEQFIVHIEEYDQTIIMHEGDAFPSIVRVDA